MLVVERCFDCGVRRRVFFVAVDVAAPVGVAAVAAHAELAGVHAYRPTVWVDVAVT